MPDRPAATIQVMRLRFRTGMPEQHRPLRRVGRPPDGHAVVGALTKNQNRATRTTAMTPRATKSSP